MNAQKLTVCLFIINMSFLVGIVLQTEAGLPVEGACQVSAKVLSLEENKVKESSYKTKLLTTVLMEIEIQNDGTPIDEKAKAENLCREFKNGRKVTVFSVREKDFINRYSRVGIDTTLMGQISSFKQGRKTEYVFQNVKVVK